MAFIGATGSGKTTLVSLAARFFDATEGQVLLDGEDIREYSFKALYDRLGYVAQKAVLFSGSVEDNVNFGESDAALSEENTWEALNVARDYNTDARLRQALEDEFHDVTKLIVAQRIGTIKNADKIVVLDHGRAVGIGSHEELMKNCPVYREIAFSQPSAVELSGQEGKNGS